MFPEIITHKIFETNSYFSCEIAHNRNSFFSSFKEFSASFNKISNFAGTLGTRLSFYGI